ncbi:MAG: FliG C-terminal domain-containing protein [Litoreibacter sp.]
MCSDRSISTLTGAQKAAIIVRLISGDGGTVPMAALSHVAQTRVAHQFEQLGQIDRDTVDAVITDFEAQMDDPSVRFPGSMASTLTMIESQLSPEVADDLRHAAGIATQSDPWEDVLNIPLPLLTATLLQEGLQVAAIVLSKLPPELASEVIASMPKDTAEEMTYAVQNTADVRPEIVTHIGRTLRTLGKPKGPVAFSAPPVERVAEILNASNSAQRDAIIEALQVMDIDFATEVRKAIFTFADISLRIKPTDVPTFVRDVPNDDMVTALAAAQETMKDTVEFILSNMSKRMAEQLREEMQELGAVKTKPGEAAMTEVTTAIRRARETGKIQFVEPDTEDEE